MSEFHPKITVIIPTRERCDVLRYSLQNVLAQDYSNFEVIVSDNFSQDGTKNIVEKFEDSRVRYINTGSRVGMSQNWEFALSHVTDGWVTVIGDDDGLLPGALEKVALLIKKTGAKAIRSETCSYTWPDLTGKPFGRLGIPIKKGWEIRASKTWLRKVILGNADYTSLPMLYNGGFVEFSVLMEIKKRSGSFIRSMTPDVYFACAISSVLKEYVYSFEPLAINGASKHSGGTSVFTSKKLSADSPGGKFLSEDNIPFHEDLPLDGLGAPPRSIQALVFESYLQSECLRREDLHKSYQYQLSLILAHCGNFKDEIYAWGRLFSSKNGISFGSADGLSSYLRRRHIFITRVRSIRRIFSTFAVGDTYVPLKNVYEASVAASVVAATKPSLIRNVFTRAVHAMKKRARL